MPLRRHLVSHEVHTVFEKGWSTLKNGDLLATAILHGYELLVSIGQNLRRQHDVRNLCLGIVVLTTTSWPQRRTNMPAVATAIDEVKTVGLVEVPFIAQ